MDQLMTERLILRRFKSEDWKDLHEYLSNEAAVKYEPYDIFDEEASRQEAINRSNNEAFWAVCLKEDGKVIGNVYFQQQEPCQWRTWEIGYVFNPNYFGNGYATESCRRILEYAFCEMMAHRITAMCNPENTPSWRLLERLGMRREGCFRKKAFFKTDESGNPIWHDAYAYAILGDEWHDRTMPDKGV